MDLPAGPEYEFSSLNDYSNYDEGDKTSADPGSWQWTVVGSKIKLPGTIWGEYAQNEDTRAWARVHAKDKFGVLISKWIQNQGQSWWVIQYERELPFHIKEEDLLPHIRGSFRQELASLGAPFPQEKKAAQPRSEAPVDEVRPLLQWIGQD